MIKLEDRPQQVCFPGSGSLPMDEAIGFPQQLLLLYDSLTDGYAANNITFEPDDMNLNMLAAFPYLDDAVAYQHIHSHFKDFRCVSKSLTEAKAIALERETLSGVCLWIDGVMNHFFFVR